MAAPVAFESVTEKEKLREIRRKERNRILKEVSIIVELYFGVCQKSPPHVFH